MACLRELLGKIQASAAQGRRCCCAESGLLRRAGIVRTADFLEMSDTDFDAVLDVNLKGAFIVSARMPFFHCMHVLC